MHKVEAWVQCITAQLTRGEEDRDCFMCTSILPFTVVPLNSCCCCQPKMRLFRFSHLVVSLNQLRVKHQNTLKSFIHRGFVFVQFLSTVIMKNDKCWLPLLQFMEKNQSASKHHFIMKCIRALIVGFYDHVDCGFHNCIHYFLILSYKLKLVMHPSCQHIFMYLALFKTKIHAIIHQKHDYERWFSD